MSDRARRYGKRPLVKNHVLVTIFSTVHLQRWMEHLMKVFVIRPEESQAVGVKNTAVRRRGAIGP